MRALAAGCLSLLIFGIAPLAAPPPLFTADDPVALRIEAPFDDLFAGAKDTPDYVVSGKLIDPGAGDRAEPLAVKISLRGHTSRRESECTFPKLKLDLAGASRGHTIVDGITTLKIGTHCGDRDDTPTRRFGRVANERAPYREVAVYQLLDALGVPTLRARPARITYSGVGEAPLERNAMLLEDDDAAIERMGGTGEITAEHFTTATRVFSVPDLVNLAFAEALVGNFDWCLKLTDDDVYRCDARMKLWNIVAVTRGGGKALPLIYDFDVSGMVAGSHRWFGDVFNASFAASQSQREVEVIAQLQRTRTLFSRAELDAGRQRFLARRAEAYRRIDRAALDAEARAWMREYLDAFFREIESDRSFYRPVIVTPGVRPRAEGQPSAPVVCASRGAIPVGTPVSEPLETRGAMVKVVLLDALWHWGPSTRCAPIQSGAVWVEKSAVSPNFPAR